LAEKLPLVIEILAKQHRGHCLDTLYNVTKTASAIIVLSGMTGQKVNVTHTAKNRCIAKLRRCFQTETFEFLLKVTMAKT